MAAELEELISRYQRHGLVQAAEYLSTAKRGLQRRGVLPPRLSAEVAHPQQPPPGATAVPELVQYEWSSFSSHLVLWRERDADWLHRAHELDALGLTMRQRNALVRAGFSTISEVEQAVQAGLLADVYQVGRRGATAITEQIRRHGSRQTE